MKTVVSFGEIMLRLKAPGTERFFQSPAFEASFGGGEANAAISLAQFGHASRYVSALPEGPLGDGALQVLRAHGVDSRFIIRRPGRMGLYFLEAGSNQRPSVVIYDRQESAIAIANPAEYDWPRIFAGANWFHLTGITPAISEPAATAAFAAARFAASRGIMVSLDLNFRKKLWNWGRSALEVMSELATWADILIANEDDLQNCLGLAGPEAGPDSANFNPDSYQAICKAVLARYPRIKTIAVTLRQSRSAEHNTWSAVLLNKNDWLISRRYEILDIADRVGAGDAFSAALIHGLLTGMSHQAALEFASAAACLKHSIPGDFNLASVAEVQALVDGDSSGRIQR